MNVMIAVNKIMTIVGVMSIVAAVATSSRSVGLAGHNVYPPMPAAAWPI